MLISCKSRKINAKEEEYLTFKAQKSQIIISTTYIDVENQAKSLISYINKKSKDIIREQKSNTFRDHVFAV